MKNQTIAVTPKSVLYLSLVAIATGAVVATMASSIFERSAFAGIVTFLIGAGVAGVGIMKAIQAVKVLR